MIIVNGPPGIGKSTLCRNLLEKTPGSVWLDGDWCWYMNPWVVDEETIKMVEDNIAFILGNYLKNSHYEFIFFSWVLHREEILKRLLSKLKDYSFDHRVFTLVSSRESLRERVIQDKRSEENIDLAIDRLDLYGSHDSIKLDTSNMKSEEVCSLVLKSIAGW